MIALEDFLNRGVTFCTDTEGLRKKMESGKQLRVKFGIDPTAPIVHLGHAVPIMKLRQAQQLGHKIVLIIGDSTAQVGDTSDKTKERPMLTREQTREHSQGYLDKIGKIIDLSKTEIRYNSEWMDTTNFNLVGYLASKYSVAEMLDRDNFSKRYKSGMRISLQEFLYPIMQGWDSVQIQADLELGGNDQYFNLLAGRRLQEAYGQEKQEVLTFDLLLGPDGEKMSKTGGNCIDICMNPKEMFVKLMELQDNLIITYFEVATTVETSIINEYKNRLESGEDPRTFKRILAAEIVRFYHGENLCNEAEQYYESVIVGGGRPDLDSTPQKTLPQSSYPLLQLVKELGYFGTTGECRDAILGGGVKIETIPHTDPQEIISLDSNFQLIQVGKKRFIYVNFQ